MRWSLIWQRGSAPLAGITLALSFPSCHFHPLMWGALLPLFIPAFRDGYKTCFGRFFLAGLCFYLILLQWLMANIYWAGGAAVLGYVLVCVYMAAYWGLLGLAWVWLRDRMPCAPFSLAVAMVWVMMESLQSLLLTGFGWGALGYAQGANPWLLQMASLGGVSLVSAVVVVFNVLVAQSIAQPKRRLVGACCAAALLVGSHAIGSAMIKNADYVSKPFRVGLVQADFPQQMKWDPEYTEEMVYNTAEKSRLLASQTNIDLVVWPEALVTEPIETPGIREVVTGLARETHSALFTGAARYIEETGGWANSSCLIDPDGAIVGHYDKIHLAPFGEYAPLGRYLPVMRKLIPAIGEMTPGASPNTFSVGARRFGPLICFEMLFPWMAERLRRDGADFLVVITNLGWFGESSALPQELEITRFRAVETRLPIVHCANTGISGLFDPWGRFTGIGRANCRLYSTLPLTAPGKRPVPYGPVIFPWAATAFAAVLLVAPALTGKKMRPKDLIRKK